MSKSISVGDTVTVRVGGRDRKTHTYEAVVISVNGDKAVIETPKGAHLNRRLETLTLAQ